MYDSKRSITLALRRHLRVLKQALQYELADEIEFRSHLIREDRDNEIRTHLSLEKDAPVSRAVKLAGTILCRPVLGGLHHQYVRI